MNFDTNCEPALSDHTSALDLMDAPVAERKQISAASVQNLMGSFPVIACSGCLQTFGLLYLSKTEKAASPHV